ncbi:TPA: amino acid transporter [Stenotrophomonas maltophilia]|uniref:amino acid transporter n=1 Tax=Stenotrophomonas maltophilia TaxID=40324 RepID=UPI0015DD7334|nr:amino acid transporter [Stenotrophomonas maltophilia]MBA0449024.1 amino acid transporter [Stenotrophomonas maltophilia]HEL2977839.1 amino acid transporter [Stenotrophomonas maltophilia]
MDSDYRHGQDAELGMDHFAMMAMALLLGGSVTALIGEYTSSLAGPAIVLSLALAALGTLPMLYCLRVMNLHVPTADGLLGMLLAGWGRAPARLMGAALLLELVVASIGAAQSLARHARAVLASRSIEAGDGMPEPLMAAAGLALLGGIVLLPSRRVALSVCALLTVKIGVGLLLLALAARHVHYANWVPWLPDATAPYRFGVGGVLAASVPLLGMYAGAGLALGVPGMGRQARARSPQLLAVALLSGMLLLMVLAALQAGLVGFPSLAGGQPLPVALQRHPQLQWVLPLLPLASVAGLAALMLVLLSLAARLAAQLWPAARDEVPGLRMRLMAVVVILPAALLALVLPMGGLPVLPGPVTLLVMAALSLAALRVGRPVPGALPVLAPLAAALCVLAAAERMRAWPG